MKNCDICNKKFQNKTNGKYCSKQCKKEAARVNYHKRKKEKKCDRCGKIFIGTKNKKLCSKCSHVRVCNYEEIEKNIICYRCGKIMDTIIVKNVGKLKDKLSTKLCDECYSRFKKRQKEKMKSDKNPMIQIYGKAKPRSKMSKKEWRKVLSERMKGDNNPMKDPKIAKKVGKKLTGRKMKRGREHGNWKGNRKRSQVIRSRLYYPWIKPILERDNYTCAKCRKRGGRLEVHHISPTFSEIVDEVLNNRIMADLNYEDFEIVCKKVIDKHKNAKGITYCVDCHKIVDNRRW